MNKVSKNLEGTLKF